MPILYPAWTLIFEVAVSVLAIVSFLLSAQYKYYIFFAAILFLAICDPFTGVKEIDYYFNDRLLSTAFGLGIAVLITKGIVLPKKIAYLCIPFSLLLLVMTKLSSPLTWSFPVAVLVMAVISLEDQISFIMIKPFQAIALASYSIFLIHPHIIWQFDYWLPENRSRWIILIIMFLSVIIGVIVHLKVEMPLISLVNKLLSKLPTVKNRQKT
ncbi:peptidoglycan/LPS O-acetylase OafA/YrhL [Paenochrobactrum gallinarii]|uniref:Peptidoglycan/LPS O-acetylase OafA/YrhL n=1 Tax=Paenochrobactrum gallinarii TaxID=643673 RepID=A0A841LWZ4_9HYPH|nr:hypothetical protein [Paenochrobactrum gallinarii]MBB6262713.1 peptidoglycan/LPS O-acetylase OafA/YrhL [Paenochrobactrum gallinarii]